MWREVRKLGEWAGDAGQQPLPVPCLPVTFSILHLLPWQHQQHELCICVTAQLRPQFIAFSLLVLAAEKKPVIASMADVAASGGYYIAMAAQKIVAERLTITGSIGVVTGKVCRMS
jgi:hypothetical protein